MNPRLLATFVALLLGSGVYADLDEIGGLKVAATANDQQKILDKDSDYVFDFNVAPGGEGAGGSVKAAIGANFPAVIGQGLSMAIAYLGPCGLVTPHTHPRAAEFAYSINGTMMVGMLSENGARFVANEVGPGEAVLFTEGSIHFEMNTGCEPMVFVAALNSDDPGVSSLAQEFFGLPPDVVAASLGNLTPEDVAKIESKIADSVALGTDECLAKCGITRGEQPTTQRVERLPSNALPNGYYGPSNGSSGPYGGGAGYGSGHDSSPSGTPSPAGTPSSTGAPPESTGTTPSNDNKTPADQSLLAGNLSNSDDNGEGKLRVLDIALIAVVAVLGLGYIALGAAWCIRRRGADKKGKYAPIGGEKGGFLTSKTAPFESFRPDAPYGEGGRGHSTPYDGH